MRRRAARHWSTAAILALAGYVGGHLVCFGLGRSMAQAVDIAAPLPAGDRGARSVPRTSTTAGAGGPTSRREPTTLKVMSYNLNHVTRGNDNSPDNDPHFAGGLPEWAKIAMTLRCLEKDPGRLERHLAEIVGQIRAEDPDLVFLQEADRDGLDSGGVDTASRIARATGYRYAVWGPKWSMDLGLVREVTGNAILSRFPIVEAHNVLLNELTLLRRCLGLHTALVAVIQVGDRRLRLVNTHLYSKKHGYDKKVVQVRRLLRLVRDSPEPVIWGGDLNSSFRRLHSQRPASNDPTLGLLYDSGLARESGFFASASLDYLLLRPGDPTRYGSLRLLPPVATDHHILVAQVELLAQRWGPVHPVTVGAWTSWTPVPPSIGWSEVLALVWR